MIKYRIIDYFDVWGNEEDGWEVNNLCVQKMYLIISDNATNDFILHKLVSIGYLKSADVAELELSGENIEIIAKSNRCPLGRLEKF